MLRALGGGPSTSASPGRDAVPRKTSGTFTDRRNGAGLYAGLAAEHVPEFARQPCPGGLLMLCGIHERQVRHESRELCDIQGYPRRRGAVASHRDRRTVQRDGDPQHLHGLGFQHGRSDLSILSSCRRRQRIPAKAHSARRITQQRTADRLRHDAHRLRHSEHGLDDVPAAGHDRALLLRHPAKPLAGASSPALAFVAQSTRRRSDQMVLSARSSWLRPQPG